MGKVRVLHCLGKLDAGGAETLVMNVFRCMDSNDIEFNFLLFDATPGFYDKEVKSKGCRLYYLDSISKVGFIAYMKQLNDFFKEHPYFVVHSHMDWLGGFISYAAHRAGIKKIIVHSHANQDIFKANFIHKLMITVNKILINKYADYCLACSEEAGKSLFKGDFEVLFNGIDFNKFKNPDPVIVDKIKKELNIDSKNIVLGCVGSFSKNKNQIFLIELLAKLMKTNSNYKLVLVGKGKEEENLRRRVKELNLEKNVVFAGVRKEIAEFMSMFDIFLFPSIHEGLGIVGIEAQASGLPCIVSNSIPKSIVIDQDLVKFVNFDLDLWVNNIRSCGNKKMNTNLNDKYSISNTSNRLIEIYTDEEKVEK